MILKETDIRIGNFLLHKDSEYVVKVDGILKNCWISAIAIYGDYFCTHPIEGFDPIELTEEWINKLGFKQCDNFEREYYLAIEDNQRHCAIIDHYENDYLFKCWYWQAGVYVKHVHQVQNIVFSLDNKELTLITGK
jgi:hypothetical protein